MSTTDLLAYLIAALALRQTAVGVVVMHLSSRIRRLESKSHQDPPVYGS